MAKVRVCGLAFDFFCLTHLKKTKGKFVVAKFWLYEWVPICDGILACCMARIPTRFFHNAPRKAFVMTPKENKT